MYKSEQKYIEGALLAFEQAGLAKEASDYYLSQLLYKMAATTSQYTPDQARLRNELINEYKPKHVMRNVGVTSAAGVLGGLGLNAIAKQYPWNVSIPKRYALGGSLALGGLSGAARYFNKEKPQLDRVQNASLPALKSRKIYDILKADLYKAHHEDLAQSLSRLESAYAKQEQF
jgi:hypothetical protein